MAHQRTLRLAAAVLLALTAAVVLMLPSGLLPPAVGVVLAALAALALAAVIVQTLWNNHHLCGVIQSLLYFSLLLVLVGGVGSHYLANEMFVELPQNSTVILEGRGMNGYSLAYEGASDDNGEVRFDVVLTRPDQLSFHESIAAAMPMDEEGIEVHPIGAGVGSAIFLIKWDVFQPLMFVGGGLFIILFCLSTLPFVRKGGKE